MPTPPRSDEPPGDVPRRPQHPIPESLQEFVRPLGDWRDQYIEQAYALDEVQHPQGRSAP